MAPTPTSPSGLRSLRPTSNKDDGSSHLHRQLIGVLGGTLPLMVWAAAGFRPMKQLPQWQLLSSISHYYYTGAVAAFVGLLIALGLVLLTYGGYKNKAGFWDRLVGRIAGVAALLVAIFPTTPLDGMARPDWWIDRDQVIHLGAAGVLFTCFAIFSLWLFRRGASNSDPSKPWRNAVYAICGVIILAGMVWVVLTKGSIFWPETMMLLAFSTSWLVKGRVDETIMAVLHNLWYHPRGSARAVIQTVMPEGDVPAAERK